MLRILTFRTLSYSEPEVYSVPCQTYAIEVIAKIVNGYNCFRNISFSHSLLNEINKTFFNAGLIFARKVFMQHKKSMVVEGTVKFDIPPGSFTVILLITFDFQYFLTQELHLNPYKIQLIPLESL